MQNLKNCYFLGTFFLGGSKIISITKTGIKARKRKTQYPGNRESNPGERPQDQSSIAGLTGKQQRSRECLRGSPQNGQFTSRFGHAEHCTQRKEKRHQRIQGTRKWTNENKSCNYSLQEKPKVL